MITLLYVMMAAISILLVLCIVTISLIIRSILIDIEEAPND